jgi:hypothetical protein
MMMMQHIIMVVVILATWEQASLYNLELPYGSSIILGCLERFLIGPSHFQDGLSNVPLYDGIKIMHRIESGIHGQKNSVETK